MSAPPEIIQLVERFDAGFNEYKHARYGETQVRVDFINPFFEALGWDMSNKNRREVTHEYALDDLSSKIHPDYSFNAGGEGKIFFLEAKKPSVNLEKGENPALQLRRYSWTANHPIGALTDFEEFSVYYGRGIEPKITDSPDVARLIYCNFMDYADRWDEIYAIFSRQAVLDGSLEKYAAVSKAKRGSQEVDAVFLNDIENWRSILANHIAANNPELSQRELNALVQQTIDRIIFLRICEDRDIEPYGTLETLLSCESVYQKLVGLFKNADSKYNSGLFHFKNEPKRGETADTLALSLKIQDEPLKQIIQRLYFPIGPYAFSVMPADILGQVYERFLGRIIQIQPDRSVVVEEKPEVRKAGGVYYTPTYIVDYIVRNTVGKLVDGKKPDDVSSMRVLDPACGSGSFLIRAYQYLLNWHLDWYLNHDPQKHTKGKAPKLYQDSNDHWHLTIAERKRILLNNIYGVDIDAQAVEVSKLSLLLKVLEGENSQSMTRQLSLFKERALPDLGNNIKCGNSLIGRDFYSGQQPLFTFDEKLRINAFDWETEFADIMKAGGFDAVIGNPPYVRQEGLANFKPYFEKNYSVFNGMADLYVYFIEKGVSLLRQGGFFSYIVANKWFRANYGNPMRQWMKQQHILEIIDFGDLPVFKQATTYPCIVVIQKKAPGPSFQASTIKTLDFSDLQAHISQYRHDVRQDTLDKCGWSLANQNTQDLFDRLSKIGVPLGEYVDGKIYRGVLTGLNEAFVIDNAIRQRLIAEDPKSAEVIKPFLAGRDIKRYQKAFSEKYVIFARRGIDIEKYAPIRNYLEQFKESLMPRPKDWKGEKWQGRKPGAYQWYEIQDTIDYYGEFEKPKIVYAEIATRGQFVFDENKYFTDTTAYILGSDSKYLLGIFNSRLWTFLFSQVSSSIRGGFFRWKFQYMFPLPIRTINFSDVSDTDRHDRVVFLVQKMLDLNKQLSCAREKQEIEELKRDIAFTDKEIDRLVYDLYNLTDDEITIVEKM